MPGESGGSYARHLSGDGSRVIGWAEIATGKTAFVWDEANGMRRLHDVLTLDHGLDLKPRGGRMRCDDGSPVRTTHARPDGAVSRPTSPRGIVARPRG